MYGSIGVPQNAVQQAGVVRRFVGSFRELDMTLLQAVAVIIGIGFVLALIRSIMGPAGNAAPGSKARLVDLAVPFALRWALYSSGVALALGLQYLLLNQRG